MHLQIASTTQTTRSCLKIRVECKSYKRSKSKISLSLNDHMRPPNYVEQCTQNGALIKAQTQSNINMPCSFFFFVFVLWHKPCHEPCTNHRGLPIPTQNNEFSSNFAQVSCSHSLRPTCMPCGNYIPTHLKMNEREPPMTQGSDYEK